MSKKEKLIDYDQYITPLEIDYLNNLKKEALSAKKRAEGCGCNQCHNEAQSAMDLFLDERDRLVRKPTMDHEERLLLEYAFKKLMGD